MNKHESPENETGIGIGVGNHELLSAVTGLGEEETPTEDHFAEADRLIADPEIPCSDLRGTRDLNDTHQ